MAPYDIAATARGAGAVNPGQACAILGTTLCTEIITREPDTGGEPCGINIAYRGRERILRAFPTLSGTEVLDWACRTLSVADPAALGGLAFGAQPGAGGLAFLPYLSPAGERAPFLDPHARGALLGACPSTTPRPARPRRLRGLSLVVRDCLAASGTEVRELRLCGGGSASDDWCRLIADVTGVPTARSADTELGAKGAFLTGLVLTGAESSMHSAAATLRADARELGTGRRARRVLRRALRHLPHLACRRPLPRLGPPYRPPPRRPPAPEALHVLTPCPPTPSTSDSTSAPRAPARSPWTAPAGCWAPPPVR
ncbi:hypothetical protein LT493_12255 [Streptomyces tricolor]|nr:hypothetical protein [Streptomyces tricolor]